MDNYTYRHDIDGLRGISVIAVILYHYGFNIFPGGFLGVDIFFVISGFLITQIIKDKIINKKFSYTEFIIKRSRRILPCLFLVITITIFCSYFFMTPSYYANFSISVISTIFFVSNFFFWEQINYFNDLAIITPLLHTWSLSIEEQFYIFYPFIMWLAYVKGSKKIFLFILFIFFLSSIFLSSSLGSLTSKYFNNIEWHWLNPTSASFYFTPFRAWEIIIGCIAALIYKDLIIKSLLRDIVCFISLVVVIFSFSYFTKNSPMPSYLSLIPTLAIFFLILFNNKKNYTYKILSYKGLAFIGLISYSLYLWHQPVLAFALQLKPTFSSTDKFFFIALSIIFSIFSWRYLEQPFRDTQKIGKKRFLKIIVIWPSFLLLFSIIIIINKGFINFYPKEKHDILKYTLNDYSDYVEKNWTLHSGINFSEKYSFVIIGDSFGQDFLNILYENEKINGQNIGTYYIQNFFYCIEQNNCKPNKFLSDINNLNAELLIFSKKWNKEDVKYFREQILDKVKKDANIKVIGNKNFGNVNIKLLSNLSYEKKIKYKVVIPENERIIIDSFAKQIPDIFYYDLVDKICSDYVCNLFNNNGELISYDGFHLTKKGANYISKKINIDKFLF